jgi:excisionase family DNA binding protein
MRTGAPPSARKRLPPDRLRLYAVDAVAEQLGVSTKTVRRWIAAGDLPVYRLGRQLRISEADLAAFIAQRRHP